jgi:hypothetical protein
MHVYGVTPRKDKRGFDLISDALPFAGLRSGGGNGCCGSVPSSTVGCDLRPHPPSQGFGAAGRA